MAVQIRPVLEAEFDDAGRVTALAYEVFGPEGASPNPDYLSRVADLRTRARHAVVLGAFEVGRVLGTVTVELSPTASPVGTPVPRSRRIRRMFGCWASTRPPGDEGSAGHSWRGRSRRPGPPGNAG
jgi:hypothetical protein